MRSCRLVAVAALVTALAPFGCESVPEIRFVADDAASDAGERPDAPADAAALDGATGADASSSCTGASPGAGSTCCGTVWCVGDCAAANCDACSRKGCTGGDLCCGKTGTVVCKSRCP